ncbi:MAG: cupredoxin domain-containing protein [Candidatus Micrarchaeota archaeon]|nr:cupredoxin domain-containing protein [Candidatus Micrarchaeota archaeon]
MVKVIEIALLVFVLAVVAAIPFVLAQGTATNSSPTISSGSSIPVVNGVQELRLYASSSGYSVSAFTVKKGVPVRILFSADQYAGCGKQLLIPAFGVNKIIQGSEESTIEFTPDKEGTFPYRCSMNMFKGTMTVIA